MFRELSLSEPSNSVLLVPMVESVMWVQREKKMFPRWKERVVVITGKELCCYKKGSAQLSDVGSLMFKVTWHLYVRFNNIYFSQSLWEWLNKNVKIPLSWVGRVIIKTIFHYFYFVFCQTPG